MMTNKNNKAIAFIFDMDGVIVDNAEHHYKAWEEFCKREGLPYARGASRYWFGNTNREILRKVYGRELDDEEVKAKGEAKESIYRELIADELAPVKGLKPLLKDMHMEGYQVALATSAPTENVEFVLGRLGIRDAFDPIVDASGVIEGKPSPEIYLKAARLLDKDPAACLVFEDAIAGIRAARSAGMKVVGLITTLDAHELKDTVFNIADFTETGLEDLTGIFGESAEK